MTAQGMSAGTAKTRNAVEAEGRQPGLRQQMRPTPIPHEDTMTNISPVTDAMIEAGLCRAEELGFGGMRAYELERILTAAMQSASSPSSDAVERATATVRYFRQRLDISDDLGPGEVERLLLAAEALTATTDQSAPSTGTSDVLASMIGADEAVIARKAQNQPTVGVSVEDGLKATPYCPNCGEACRDPWHSSKAAQPTAEVSVEDELKAELLDLLELGGDYAADIFNGFSDKSSPCAQRVEQNLARFNNARALLASQEQSSRQYEGGE